jgi:hypothetical protein
MYRFTRRTEEERDLLNQLNARADAFHEEVLSKPIVADASKGICRFCTYLRVCAEGQKVVFGSVGDSIPQASIQRSIPGF